MFKKLRHKLFSSPNSNLCRMHDESGAVTAEAAVASLSIATLLGACLTVLVIIHAHFTVFEAARTGSRMIARGESEQVVYEKINDIAPMSQTYIDYGFDSVTVWVNLQPIGVVSWLQTTVSSHSTSGLE